MVSEPLSERPPTVGPVSRPQPGADLARVRSMLESAPAYFYLADPSDSTTLYRSPQAESILGYSLAEWAENPGLWEQILHPDDRDRVMAEFRASSHGGKPFKSEYRLLTKAGKVRWLRDHSGLIHDPSGDHEIVQGVVLDITEQKEAEQVAVLAQGAADAQSRFLDTVFLHAPLGVARVGVDMRVIDANPRLRAMLATPGDDMAGRVVAEFLVPSELDKVVAEFAPLWKGEVETIEADSQALRADRTKLWLHWTATTVRGADGSVDYFLTMFEDITAKHTAEEAAMASLAELDRISQLKSEFISVVSHEFRTALTGIQGFSEILRDTAGLSPAEVTDFAGDINKDALRLNRMITEMLDLDRMESGRMSLTLSPVDLNLALREAVSRIETSGHGHTFKLDLDPQLPAVKGDGDRLFQVITNLLSNAVKYSPDGGEVMVRSWRHNEGVTVSVRDRGLGMPAEFLTKVFERYERYETSKIIGTGLGLPISKQIIELHRGRIWVDSAEGMGSEFSFWVPTG